MRQYDETGETQVAWVLGELRSLADPGHADRMITLGSRPREALGVPVPRLRSLAKRIGKSHSTALVLWRSGLHEARIVATLIADADGLSRSDAAAWAHAVDTWDLCDHLCVNLLKDTAYSWELVEEWTRAEHPFVRRAAAVLVAAHAVHNRGEPDERFERALEQVARIATDEREYVRKGVSWALRQVGKRNPRLNRVVVELATSWLTSPHQAQQWIGRHVLRELVGGSGRRLAKSRGAPGQPRAAVTLP